MPKAKTEDESVTYKLKRPVTFGTEKYTQIVFERPKGKHLKGLGSDIDLGKLMSIAPKISEAPPQVFDNMDCVDYMKVSELISGFLDDGQKDGEKS